MNRKENNFNKELKENDNKEKVILGDEWENWDGKSDIENFNTSKSVFFLFSFSLIIIINGFLYLVYYLIFPRINEINYLSDIILVMIILFNFLSLLYIFSLCFIIYLKINSPLVRKHKLKSIAEILIKKPLINFILDKVISLSKIFSFSVDRVRNSFIKVNNIITNSFNYKKSKNNELSKKILILLPRCLTKEILEKIKRYEENPNIKIFVVSGGTLARKKIKEYRPDKILCVACERDLVSGIRDVKGKIPILAIPNQRPEGPCKNTIIDIDEFENCLKLLID